MRSARLLAASSVLGWVLAHAGVALGCRCVLPGHSMTPNASRAAPTNAIVRIVFPVRTFIFDESTLVLNRIGPAGNPVGNPVLVTQQAFTATELRIITLRPTSPLSPDSKYEVRVSSWENLSRSMWDDDRTLIGSFTTGTHYDKDPPSWDGVVKATFVQPDMRSRCSGSEWWARIELNNLFPSSDVTDFGVWQIDGGTFEPSSTPVAVLRGHGPHFLGLRGCNHRNFRFPPLGEKQSVEVWMAPIDLAGHIGKPARVVIDLAAGPPWPPQ